MRIVFISDWFAERMGYAENSLPKAMASLGEDVHVVAANVQPYFNSPMYAETYEPFIGPAVVPVGVRTIDGVTLHRLPHQMVAGRLRIRGLIPTLARLRPDVVQTFEVASIATYEAAAARRFLQYRLFVESHLHRSVFNEQKPQWQLAASFVLGSLVGHVAERCFAISSDVADIAVERLGIPSRKVSVCSLGVDTQLFRPPTPEERQSARARFGWSAEERVFVYTGRFAADKGPQLLAEAIATLNDAGFQCRGLFVGSGTRGEVEAIRQMRGCVIHQFVPAQELPPFYWGADVGVWPRQESTSQLDAAACGLPIIISDKVHVSERVDGNGLQYREGDVGDLMKNMRTLDDGVLRRNLGSVGSSKMRERFSWLQTARARIEEYRG
jgi:glycosyltransferase involved in cell wall biosynthesis